MGRYLPGAQYAFRIVSFGSPEVRERFPRGVLVDPDGYPEWMHFARAMVRVPDPPAGMTLDEVRVVDVLAANTLMERGDDLLWYAPDRLPGGTPQCWTWTHRGPSGSRPGRELACVPIELHAAWRHAGGIGALAEQAPASAERGLRIDYAPQPVEASPSRALSEQLLERVERSVGVPLPPAYRRFLAATDGATPGQPAVLRGYGFLADQRLFGIDRENFAEHLIPANEYRADRFTKDFLTIGYVQGGMVAVKIRGGDLDSIWYWDDDDPRDEQQSEAETICANLLHRCADDIGQFWDRLQVPARELRDTAAAWAAGGDVAEMRPDGIGDSLPVPYRAPWQSEPIPDADYFADPVVQVALLRPDPA